jgi:toxin ParE1/3/4
VHQIEERFEPLRHHPALGPNRDHLAKGLHVHFHRDYAIYYRFTDTELVIVRVVHGSRDAIALFNEDTD